MRRRSKVLIIAGTLLLMSGFVASAMGVLHPFDRLISRQEISRVNEGVYTMEAYKCGLEAGLRHYVYYVEMDGVRGYSGGDQLIYVYDWSRPVWPDVY